MLPAGWCTFACESTVRTSSRVRSLPASACGSTCTRTAGFCRPFSVTSPTPTTCEIFCARIESAWSSTCVSGSASEETARVSTGVSAGLLRLYVGGVGSVRGSRFVAALMAACTSCSAAPMGRSRLNCRVICDVP